MPTTKKVPESVYDMPRNDLELAVEFYRAHRPSGDDLRVLLLLQDDSGDALLKRLRTEGLLKS